MTNEQGAYFYDVMQNIKSQATRGFFEKIRIECSDIQDLLEEAIDNSLGLNLTPEMLKTGLEASERINRLANALDFWKAQEVA